MAKIVLTCWGSYGDLYPFLGLALAMRSRGHEPVLATSAAYRSIVEAQGVHFHAVRPDVDLQDYALVSRLMDPRWGTERILRDLLMPALRDSYSDLSVAIRHADLLVSHPVTFAAPILAEKLKIPWVSTALAPMSFFSAYDLPIFPPAPRLTEALRKLPGAGRILVPAAKASTRRWVRPISALRKELGLLPGGHPVFEGQFSPRLTLALFPSVLANPQKDWPSNVEVTGLVNFNDHACLPDRLVDFLSAGPPPIVFTLGSSAVGSAGSFYEESLRITRELGARGVFLIGKNPANRLKGHLPESVIMVESAPHSVLFPHASAVVHQGGAGTTGHALRAGRPMLVVPFAHDQPDNAARVERIGVARTLFPSRYKAKRAAVLLDHLMYDVHVNETARRVGVQVRSEDGAARACDALLRTLAAG